MNNNKNNNHLYLFILFLAASLFLSSCGEDAQTTPEELQSMMATTEIAPGDICAYGGVRIDTGIDENGDGELDEDEVDETEYMCNEYNPALPAVVATSPAPDDTDVAVSTTVNAVFNRNMDPVTITDETFLLNDGDADVAGGISYSDTIAVFTPSAVLAPYTTYTATVLTGVKDTGGQALVAEYAWSFETGDALADNEGPEVVSTVPADGTAGVALSTPFTAAFDEPLTPSTVDQTTFLLEDGDGTPIVGDVTYSGNTATFTPSSTLCLETVYTATISGGDDGAVDLWGNPMEADYAWSFTTQARSWSAPVKIESLTVWDASSPTLAMDDAGNAWVGWRQWDGSYNDGWMNRYDVDTGWGTEDMKVNSTGNTVGATYIRMNSDGHTVAIFTNNYPRLYAGCYDPLSDTWDGFTDLGGTFDGFDFAINDTGYVFIVKSVSDNIYAERRVLPAGGWEGDTLLELGAMQDIYPRVAIDENDRALAVWWDTLGGSNHLNYNRYDGGWDEDESVAYGASISGYSWYGLRMDAVGNGMLYSLGNIGEGTGLYEIRYDSGEGTWSAPRRIDSGTSTPLSAVVAMDPSGCALATWLENDSTADSVFVSRYDAASDTWSEPLQIDGLDYTAKSPTAGVDQSGNGYVLWEQNNGADADDIYVARYDVSAGTWSLPKMLEQGAGNAQHAVLTVNDSGQAMAVWAQEDPEDDNHYSIYAARLE